MLEVTVLKWDKNPQCLTLPLQIAFLLFGVKCGEGSKEVKNVFAPFINGGETYFLLEFLLELVSWSTKNRPSVNFQLMSGLKIQLMFPMESRWHLQMCDFHTAQTISDFCSAILCLFYLNFHLKFRC